MDRFPVGRAIAHAYGFLFGRIFAIVALSWVAAVFYAGLRFALFQTEPLLRPMAHPEIALVHLAGVLAALLLTASVAVPLTRLALGEQAEWLLAFFAIGARELKLFGALLRLGVLIAGTLALAVLAVKGAALAAKAALVQWPVLAQSGWPVETVAHDAVTVLAVLAAIYVVLRASFFLFPVAAAEPKASLSRAWALGRGNVLRMAAVTLAVMVPLYALLTAVQYALMGPALIDAAAMLISGQNAAPLMALLASHAGAIAIVSAVVMVAVTALNAGASASAYQARMGMAVEAEVVHIEPGADDAHDVAAAALAEPVPHAEAHEEPAHEETAHDEPTHADARGEPAHEEPAHEEPRHAEAHDDAPLDGHGAEDHGHAVASEGEPVEDAHEHAAENAVEQSDAPAGEDDHAAPHHDIHADGADVGEAEAVGAPDDRAVDHAAEGHGEPDAGGHAAEDHHDPEKPQGDGHHAAAPLEPEVMELDAPLADAHSAEAETRVLEHA